ncbi:MAG: radical SAM protein [Elusimicrobia bacterium]|nr:radical SAM protein [Elusimicrobiota bacterium]
MSVAPSKDFSKNAGPDPTTRFGTTRARQSRVSRWWGDPRYIAIDLTYRCGFSCPFCFVKTNKLRSGPGNELSLPQLRAFIDSLKGKPRQFYLTGGEPLLRKDLSGIVSHIKKQGHSVLITTNAWLLDRQKAFSLAKSGADEIVISLHGLPHEHDKITAANGSFYRAAKAIRLLRMAGKNGRPAINIWCTINAANHARLHELYICVKKLRPDIIAFNHLEFARAADIKKTGAILGKVIKLEPSQSLLRGLNKAALWRQLLEIKKEKDPKVKFYPDLALKDFRKWYSSGELKRKSGCCSGQWNSLWLSPGGEVLSCQPLGLKFGSIKDRAWRKVYDGRAYNEFREKLLAAGGFLPVCSRCGRVPYTGS